MTTPAVLTPALGMMTKEQIVSRLSEWQSMIQLKKVGRGHRYTYAAPGEKPVAFSSVTTILGCRVSPRLIDWSSKVERSACIETAWKLHTGSQHVAAGNKEGFEEQFLALAGVERENQRLLREAGSLGTEIHTLIEWFLLSLMGEPAPEPQVSDRALAVFGDFEKWAESVNLEPVAIEARLVNVREGYGGSLDWLAFATLPQRPRRLYVGDNKSSRGIYPEHRLQSGAYRGALVDMGLPEAGGLLLHLPKEGEDVGTVKCIEVEEPLDELLEVFMTHSRQHSFYGRYR